MISEDKEWAFFFPSDPLSLICLFLKGLAASEKFLSVGLLQDVDCGDVGWSFNSDFFLFQSSYNLFGPTEWSAAIWIKKSLFSPTEREAEWEFMTECLQQQELSGQSGVTTSCS